MTKIRPGEGREDLGGGVDTADLKELRHLLKGVRREEVVDENGEPPAKHQGELSHDEFRPGRAGDKDRTGGKATADLPGQTDDHPGGLPVGERAATAGIPVLPLEEGAVGGAGCDPEEPVEEGAVAHGDPVDRCLRALFPGLFSDHPGHA